MPTEEYLTYPYCGGIEMSHAYPGESFMIVSNKVLV